MSTPIYPQRFITTAAPFLAKNAWHELIQVDIALKPIHQLADGITLIETSMDADTFSKTLLNTDPVFIRHLMPATIALSLSGTREHDLASIPNNTQAICTLATGTKCSVQCRVLGGNGTYNAKDVEVHIGEAFAAAGAIASFSDTRLEVDLTQTIISIFLCNQQAYIGVSTASQNLNEHCDEYRVFSRSPRDVSRAEFKLKEALRKFELSLPGGRALDAGAAPGGWTKVLADAGMEVTAVDPGALVNKVTSLPNVTHYPIKLEAFKPEHHFDLLVNDMNVDPADSARLMVHLAPHLKPNAYAILTIKLVIRNPHRLLSQTIPILQEAYAVLRLKHLFHNRREITALLRRTH